MTHSIDAPEPAEGSEPTTVPDTVTVEETDAAKGNANVYMSMTFNNIPRDVSEQILQAAHKLAGERSFSVYYDEPAEEFAG